MKRLIGFFLFLICASPAWATTTVTGKMQNLGTGNVTSNAFMRFWLRGCSGNQPRINGTSIIAPSQGGVYYFDIAADSSGNISGTLYSTRDSTGNSGGEIECGGSKTAVWYGMQAWLNGKAGPEIPIQAKNGVTLDITQVTPITTNPVVVAPTGDTTYLRLDGGNSPVTGNVQHSGVESFSNTVSLPGGNLIINSGGQLILNQGSSYTPSSPGTFGYDSTANRFVGCCSSGTTSEIIPWIHLSDIPLTTLDLPIFNGTNGRVSDSGILSTNVMTKSGASAPTLTLKTGSGGGNYTNATTSYAVADATNLCYAVTIPTGWKLGIQASGSLSTSTAVVEADAALTDNAACSTANAGVLIEQPVFSQAAANPATFSLTWIIIGDGAAHNIALQFKTTNVADTSNLINSSATSKPVMKFHLEPSN